MRFEELDREYDESKLNSNSSYIHQTNSSFNHETSSKKYKRRYSYGRDEVVSVGVWVILSVLIGIIGIIPVIGPYAALGILIAMVFMDINQNIKNWAKACLILGIVAGILILLFNL